MVIIHDHKGDAGVSWNTGLCTGPLSPLPAALAFTVFRDEKSGQGLKRQTSLMFL